MTITPLHEAFVLPAEIDVPSIADEACNAAFKLIADRIDEAIGDRTSGDFMPGEVVWLEDIFATFVRAMALNNPTVSAMQPEE